MRSIGKEIRMRSLFRNHPSRALFVAMDHGRQGTSAGIEGLADVAGIVARAGADGVLLNFGGLKMALREIGNTPVLLTIPFDGRSVEMAAKVGAAAVKTTYFGSIPISEELYDRMSDVSRASEEWGIPYMAEVVPAGPNREPTYDVEAVTKAARTASELGADVVKTSFAGGISEYRQVVRACGVPLVIMGGKKVDDARQLFATVKDAVDAGAAGGAIGRNIWQSPDPALMTKALISIIRHDASVDEAMAILKGSSGGQRTRGR